MVAATAEAEELVATSVRIKNQTAAVVCVMRLPFRRVPDEVEVASLQASPRSVSRGGSLAFFFRSSSLLDEEEKTRKDSFYLKFLWRETVFFINFIIRGSSLRKRRLIQWEKGSHEIKIGDFLIP